MSTLPKFNEGYRYCRPCESQFAAARRITSVNPGIPHSQLKSEIRALSKLQIQRTTELLGEDLTSYFEKYYTRLTQFRRQCPQCAELLYHTPLFQFTWLTHCPIHKEPLTTSCHICKRSLHQDINIRNRCRGCGAVGLPQFALIAHKSLCEEGLRRLVNAYKIVLLPERAMEARGITASVLRVDSWGIKDVGFRWDFCSSNDFVFPSLIERQFLDLDKDALWDLNIDTYSVAHKVVPLEEMASRESESAHSEETLYLRTTDFLETLLPIDWEVANTILTWIKSHTPHQHTTHLSPYHRTSTEVLNRWPRFCPCCLAFSLWFYAVAESKYGFVMWSSRYSSMFNERDCPWGPFLPDVHPTYLIAATETAKVATNNEFNLWRYRRGLLIAFQHILENCQAVDPKDANYMRIRFYPYFQIKGPQWNKSERLRKYMAFRREGVLDYYYPDEDPLSRDSDYAELQLQCQSCEAFQAVLSQHNSLVRLGPGKTISNDGLSRQEFLQLHSVVRTLLPVPADARFKELIKHRQLLIDRTDYGKSVLLGSEGDPPIDTQ